LKSESLINKESTKTSRTSMNRIGSQAGGLRREFSGLVIGFSCGILLGFLVFSQPAYNAYCEGGKNYVSVPMVSINGTDNSTPGLKTRAIRANSVGAMKDLAAAFNTSGLNNDKASPLDFDRRHLEVMSDPSNLLIPRCRHAGKKLKHNGEEIVVMSNGLVVSAHGYYGKFSDVLVTNYGVHEAAEERLISAIFDRAPEDAVMVEVGAYWAFYTVWFLRAVLNGRAWCVEADEKNRKIGLYNLALNGVTSEDFSIGFVKTGYWESYANAIGLPRSIYCILIDIQGYETALVPDLVSAIASGKLQVGYIMVGTHSHEAHEQVLTELRDDAGLRVVAALDFDNETFFHDGMILVTSISEIDNGLPSINLGSRRHTPLRTAPFLQPLTGEECEWLPEEIQDRLDKQDDIDTRTD